MRGTSNRDATELYFMIIYAIKPKIRHSVANMKQIRVSCMQMQLIHKVVHVHNDIRKHCCCDIWNILSLIRKLLLISLRQELRYHKTNIHTQIGLS